MMKMVMVVWALLMGGVAHAEDEVCELECPSCDSGEVLTEYVTADPMSLEFGGETSDSGYNKDYEPKDPTECKDCFDNTGGSTTDKCIVAGAGVECNDGYCESGTCCCDFVTVGGANDPDVVRRYVRCTHGAPLGRLAWGVNKGERDPRRHGARKGREPLHRDMGSLGRL